jgi:carbohydrate-selective porin OprB
MKKFRRSRHLALALLALSLGVVTAWTEEPSMAVKSPLRRWAEPDYFLGDWGGVRTNLSRRGVDFEFFYAGSLPDNLDGGLRRGGLYQSHGLVDPATKRPTCLSSGRRGGDSGRHRVHSPVYVAVLNG